MILNKVFFESITQPTTVNMGFAQEKSFKILCEM